MDNHNNELAELLFPNVKLSIDDCEKRYPSRNLPEGAEVTRMAPSPTGFIHLGNLYSALADERIAHCTNGVFYLRIEDTDEKRKVEGAIEAVLKAMKYFNISFDEGAELEKKSEVDYGPFYQRQREEIYHVYAKDLVKRGFAYPCFCTEDDLKESREKQTEQKLTPGYYGEWAKCRNLSFEQVKEKIEKGESYVLRLRSQGNPEKKITLKDMIMGEVDFPENTMDIVLLKSDGIPTYHFAHAVDDHLMHTTMVLRGNEWLPSFPIHYELFHLLNFDMPKYAHTAQLLKMDDGKKRKLSKRKDPELSLSYYIGLGYYYKAVKVYMMTILNSNFEQWYMDSEDKDISKFEFSVNNMSNSGALFDLMKLDNVSKEVMAELSVEETLDFYKNWAKEYRKEDYDIMFADESKMVNIIKLNKGLFENRVRKDFVNGSQMHDMFKMYFDEFIDAEYSFEPYEHIVDIIKDFKAGYDYNDDANTWFGKLKEIAEKYNYCTKMSKYKKNPQDYNGNIGNVAEMVRVAVTKEKNTPDLWNILQILGNDSVMKRLDNAIKFLEK